MSDSGKVSIHGKEYKTVALRIKEFREEYGNRAGVVNSVLHLDEEHAVIESKIMLYFDIDGNELERPMCLSTGTSDEYRESSKINSTSYLENAETSAVGRALAFLGLAGSEIASADEVSNAIQAQNVNRANREKAQQYLFGLVEADKAGDQLAVRELYDELSKNDDMLRLVWGMLSTVQKAFCRDAVKGHPGRGS